MVQTRYAGAHLLPELGVGLEARGQLELTTRRPRPMPGSPTLQGPAHLPSHTVAIQCLETAFGVTMEDSDLALPQTLPEIFEAAAASKVSLGFP